MNKMNQLEQKIRHKIDTKTKPPGALGMLEALALRIGLIQGTETPEIRNPHLLVFAGDHGIAATGLVNPYPQAVTAQMVHNFLNGGAAINVFCRLHDINLHVINAGVATPFDRVQHPHFYDTPAGRGTQDYRKGPAMSEEQLTRAADAGAAAVARVAATGSNCIAFGEMGIGNTSSAALLMSALTRIPLQDCIGTGTGANEAQLATKKATLEEVYRFHRLDQYAGDPRQLLQQVGGFEIVMMAAAYREAARKGMIIVVDGFIATAALLVALEFSPSVLAHCLFAHGSAERGHEALLRHLGARPLLQLGLRLGEGTGAALAMPLLRAAVAFLNEMASFDSAGVSSRTDT